MINCCIKFTRRQKQAAGSEGARSLITRKENEETHKRASATARDCHVDTMKNSDNCVARFDSPGLMLHSLQ